MSHGGWDVRVTGIILCHMAGARAGNVLGEGWLGSIGAGNVVFASPDSPLSSLGSGRPDTFHDESSLTVTRCSSGYKVLVTRDWADMSHTLCLVDKMEARFHYWSAYSLVDGCPWANSLRELAGWTTVCLRPASFFLEEHHHWNHYTDHVFSFFAKLGRGEDRGW